MACEDEQARVNELRAQVSSLRRECEALEYGGSDQAASCKALLYSRQAQLATAEERLDDCQNATGVFRAVGHVVFLRVNDLFGGYGGGQTNFLDAEAIFKLDSEPNRAFGFKLRDDDFLPARQGMLALLRDAFAHDFTVRTDYTEYLNPVTANNEAFRIELVKAETPDDGFPPDDVVVAAERA